MIFRKWGEGGSTAVWNFSENSSVLVASPVPNRSWCLFCCASVRVTSSHNSFSHRTVKLTWAQIVGRLRAGIETEQDNRGQLSYQIWGPITRIVPSQTKRINNQARNYSLQQYVQRHLFASCFYQTSTQTIKSSKSIFNYEIKIKLQFPIFDNTSIIQHFKILVI